MYSPISFLDVVLKYDQCQAMVPRHKVHVKSRQLVRTATSTIAKSLCTDYIFVWTELCYKHTREKNPKSMSILLHK